MSAPRGAYGNRLDTTQYGANAYDRYLTELQIRYQELAQNLSRLEFRHSIHQQLIKGGYPNVLTNLNYGVTLDKLNGIMARIETLMQEVFHSKSYATSQELSSSMLIYPLSPEFDPTKLMVKIRDEMTSKEKLMWMLFLQDWKEKQQQQQQQQPSQPSNQVKLEDNTQTHTHTSAAVDPNTPSDQATELTEANLVQSIQEYNKQCLDLEALAKKLSVSAFEGAEKAIVKHKEAAPDWQQLQLQNNLSVMYTGISLRPDVSQPSQSFNPTLNIQHVPPQHHHPQSHQQGPNSSSFS